MEGSSSASGGSRSDDRRAPLLLRACAAVCILACGITSAIAQDKPSEYDVKAAYLFNFSSFLRFGPGTEPRATFDICILGRDLMGHSLDQIAAGETINNKPVRVLRVPDPTDAHHCSVLFISAFEGDSIREDLAILGSSDVLTVSDAPDFIERGGMIQFLLEDNHVRFGVNLDAVNRTHLSLGSELLRVAATVKGSPGQGGRR
jgi:hypothetical protein